VGKKFSPKHFKWKVGKRAFKHPWKWEMPKGLYLKKKYSIGKEGK
jgi:hypothetical protein